MALPRRKEGQFDPNFACAVISSYEKREAADKVGDGTSVTTIKDINDGIPASGWFINVHNGPDLSTDLQARPIACGDIINFNTSTSTNQTVNLTLGPTRSTACVKSP